MTTCVMTRNGHRATWGEKAPLTCVFSKSRKQAKKKQASRVLWDYGSCFGFLHFFMNVSHFCHQKGPGLSKTHAPHQALSRSAVSPHAILAHTRAPPFQPLALPRGLGVQPQASLLMTPELFPDLLYQGWRR